MLSSKAYSYELYHLESKSVGVIGFTRFPPILPGEDGLSSLAY